MTVSLAQAVAFGAEQLTGSSDSPLLDARVLLAFVLDKPLSYLLTWPEQPLAEAQDAAYHELLMRRQQGEPVAYLTGTREFWSLPLQVSPATLIPRPDTEVLVEQVLAHCDADNLCCLDLGTGTGAIALALASEKPGWQIDAVDMQPEAVALAERNRQLLGFDNVTVYQSNWFGCITAEKRFDVIVSNPPYIDADDHHLEQGDVRFEPKSALVAAEQGLADIVQIAEQARGYLSEHGYLFIEHGYQQKQAVQNILQRFGYYGIVTIADYGGNDRVSYGRYKIQQ